MVEAEAAPGGPEPAGRVRWQPLAQLVLAMACWGVGTVLLKRAVRETPPLTLNTMMLTVSVGLLWGLVRWQRLRPAPGAGVARMALFGLLSPGVNLTFGLAGLTLISASLASLMQAAQPVVMLALAWLLLRETAGRRLLALVGVAVAGVLLVVGADFRAGGSLLGSMLFLVSMFTASIPLVLSRRFVGRLQPLLLVAAQQTVGLGWALGVMLLEWGWRGAASPAAFSPAAWGWAAAAGVLEFGVPYWLYFSALRSLRANAAAPFLSLIPIFGVAGGYVFLGEKLAAAQWLGAALILLAVGGIARQPAGPAGPPGPPG